MIVCSLVIHEKVAGNRDAQFHAQIKSKYNIKQNSPRNVVCMDSTRCFRPVVECACWWRGGVRNLPFCLGTAYNVSSMEDSEISWLLCWQWKHTAQNYIHLCFKSSSSGTYANPCFPLRGPIHLHLLLSHHLLIKKHPLESTLSFAFIIIGLHWVWLDWISFTMNYNV